MICGKVWKFGDNIDTDIIIPGRYLDNNSPEFLASHVMESLDPEFSVKASEGDILVAGERFGIGSSREQAVIALKAVGVRIILAESFARIFFRNAINLGLLPIVCPGCSSEFSTGDKICIDLQKCTISKRESSSKILVFREMPPVIARICKSEGLINMLKSELEMKTRSSD